MKCKNCGTENPDDAESCKKCGKPFSEKKYRLYWLSIGIGSITGLILLFIMFNLWGKESMFFEGAIPSIILAGAIATLLSYNKNVRAGYDFNAILQGIIAGLITGFILITALLIQFPAIGVILYVLMLGYLFFAIMGSSIGGIINIIREKDKKLLIPTAAVIIIISLTVGYIDHTNKTNSDFETALSNQITILELNNLLQKEADSFIKNSTNSNGDKSGLKKAQGTYQKMIDITTNAGLWNKKMLKSLSSDTQKEYSTELGKYIELKLQYYKTKKQAIDLQIQGKTKQAQAKYKEAQKLLPNIRAQEKIINNTLEKDPELQKLVEDEIESSIRYVKYNKDEVITFNFETPELLEQKYGS